MHGAEAAQLETVYLVDSNSSDRSFFQGYCFIGRDLVFGHGGAEQYLRETGQTIRPNEDGCYVAMISKGPRKLFYSDYAGYKKIFYYWIDGAWAVSNSIPSLIEHMRSNGISPGVNAHHLIAASKWGTFLNQITSYQTFVKEVRPLPVGSILDISTERVHVYPFPDMNASATYESALSDALNLWLSRMETILSDERFTLRSDLTGGMDSRVIMALIWRARQRLGGASAAGLTFRCAVSEPASPDLLVAQGLSRTYGLPLNEAITGRQVRLSSEQSYRNWKHLCVGAYHPIYFAYGAPSPFDVSFSGGGGENHRPFYAKLFKTEDHKVVLGLIRKRLNSKAHGEVFEADVGDAIRSLVENADDSGVNALILHYRAFRNRFHAGRTPQYDHNFAPLASRYFEEATRHCTKEMLDDGQIHYDIMETLMPGLAAQPFDQPEKTPSDSIMERIPRLTVAGDPSPGRVYAPAAIPVGKPPERTRLAIDLLQDDFELAIADPAVQDFWGPEVITTCKAKLDDAVVNRRFNHAVDGQPIAAVLASFLLAERLAE